MKFKKTITMGCASIISTNKAVDKVKKIKHRDVVGVYPHDPVMDIQIKRDLCNINIPCEIQVQKRPTKNYLYFVVEDLDGEVMLVQDISTRVSGLQVGDTITIQ